MADSIDVQRESSFLLTEIALDLLSNKFYDVNGLQVKDLNALYKLSQVPDDHLWGVKNLGEVLELPPELYDKNEFMMNAQLQLEDQLVDVDSILNCSIDGSSDSMEELNEKEYENDELNENNLNVECNVFSPQINTEPDILLLKSKSEADRVQYLIQLTKNEFNKIIEKSKKLYENLKHETPVQRNLKEAKKILQETERAQLEEESEQLISMIKFIKKSEFPLSNPECVSMLSQISGDVMATKEKICLDPTICI